MYDTILFHEQHFLATEKIFCYSVIRSNNRISGIILYPARPNLIKLFFVLFKCSVLIETISILTFFLVTHLKIRGFFVVVKINLFSSFKIIFFIV